MLSQKEYDRREEDRRSLVTRYRIERVRISGGDLHSHAGHWNGIVAQIG